MSNFYKWMEAYGLKDEPNFSEHTMKDCHAAWDDGYEAGKLAAELNLTKGLTDTIAAPSPEILSVVAGKAAPSQCKHEWFRTGAMEDWESRCIHCGEWKAAPSQEPCASSINDKTACLSQNAESDTQAAPTDPLDTPLPCDIHFGNGKVGKGCTLRTVQLRAQNLFAALKAATQVAPSQEPVAFAIKSYGAMELMYSDADEAEFQSQQYPVDANATVVPLYTHPSDDAAQITELIEENNLLRRELNTPPDAPEYVNAPENMLAASVEIDKLREQIAYWERNANEMNAERKRQIAELQQMIKNADEKLDRASELTGIYAGCDTPDELADEVVELREQIAKLEAALSKYGHHIDGCGHGWSCTCGFYDAMQMKKR